MTGGDRQSTVSNGLPRLTEISRAVTRGIRGLADAVYPDAGGGAPSFVESLASANATPADARAIYSGQRPGGPAQPEANLMARPGRDRAAGSSPGTAFEPLAQAPLPPAPAAPRLPPAVPMLPVASTRLPAQAPIPSVPNPSSTSFPQRGTPAPGPTSAAYQGTAYAAIPSAATSAASDQSAAAVSSVVSPSLSAATRSSSSLASTQATGNGAQTPGLALKEYPKPTRADRAGVLNWTSAAPPTGNDLDQFVAEARNRKVGWVTFVADPERMDQYGDLADRLTKAGIQPIARIGDPEGDMPVEDVKDLVKELRGHGVRYFQLFDDANVAEQTPDYRVDVQDYAQRWLAAARAVVAGGGLPGIGALSPDGDYDDLGFMRQLLSQIKERGGTDVLGSSWLALRGEAPGAAATKTDVGDLASRAEWFDRVSRQALGRSLPILATLDPTGRTERLAAEPITATASAPAEQAERALRDSRRKLPALFAASRGSLEARRA